MEPNISVRFSVFCVHPYDESPPPPPAQKANKTKRAEVHQHVWAEIHYRFCLSGVM
jgi:hypothetical protein